MQNDPPEFNNDNVCNLELLLTLDRDKGGLVCLSV